MRKYKLRELLTIKNGCDYRHLSTGSVPVYGSGGFMCFVNQAMSNKPSILLPRKGTLNNIMFIDKPFWTVDTMYWSEIKEDIVEPYYLYNYLKVLKFDGIRTGSTLPSMTSSAYYDIPVILPDYNKQTRVANILKLLNNKIELNNKINQELEQMAKTLYEYWFVQFDFPDEKGRPYKSANGKMVYNEVLKREIPEGWEVIKFDDIVEQAPKLKAIKAPEYKNQGNIPIVDQASTLITGRTDDTSYYYENERNCVVFGDVTTCFKFINFPFAKGTDGTKIINARNDRIPAVLLYQLLKNTKLPNIGFARHYMFLREIKLLLPPKDICVKYYQATKGIMDLIAKNIKENYELSITRDFLLPLLMNGQVSIQG